MRPISKLGLSFTFLLFCGFLPDVALAQRATVNAVRVIEAPVLDGFVTGEPVWEQIPSSSGFTQTSPSDGARATQATEVRIGFSDDVLYVGVVLFDDDPAGLIVADARRDAALDESDSFRFILDTFSDGQNGFVFGTNPAGVEFDAQLIGSSGGGGFGGRYRGGSGGGLNVNWDGSWQVVAVVTEEGWSAEFAIPFSTLRFPSGKDQVWGINFERTIRRNNETAFWSRLERQFDLTRVIDAGYLTGLDVPDPRNLKILPYVLGNAERDYTAADPKTESSGDFGGDLKYSITPGLTLDATYNTDFAQVEVDVQQVNLDRFSLFFPEKRPFFLENAGLFSVGEQGEVEVFFSRRIGLDEDGATVPIIGGARVTGTAGGFKVGVLNMQTDKVGTELPPNNFGVVRVLREFPNRSSVGVLFTTRIGTGSQALDDDRNLVGAIDSKLGIGDYGTLTAFVSASQTPDVKGATAAGQFTAEYSDETYNLSAGYTEVGDAYNPEVGFLRRSNYRKFSGRLFARVRPRNFLKLQELRPHSNQRLYWGRNGVQQTGYLHVDNHWEFRSGYEVHTGHNWTYEGVEEPFEISDGVIVPADEYSHDEWSWVFMMPQHYPVRLELNVIHGGFFGGERVSIESTLTARAGDKLTAEIGYGRNDVNLPGGDFITDLLRSRVSYSFTPRIYVEALGQYNSQRDEWSMNFRFSWLQDANTGLFVVYNSINHLQHMIEPGRREFPGEPQYRGLTVKYVHQFDVFK